MTASILTALDSLNGWAFLIGWVALSLIFGALLAAASTYFRRRRRRALDLELPQRHRVGIDRRTP